jgi:geranylgeranyl diphosphate synthase, type III
MEPYEYLAQTPGKGVRERLVGAFNRWLRIERGPLSKVQEVIMLLHNASLMIDDIEDNSKMRRGVPVVHSIYGVPATINTANYVYFVALQKCQQLGRPDAVTLFVDELIRLHRGQGLDIHWRDRCECPTESEYISMVLDKTGGLFRLAVGLAQCMSECELDFLPLVNSIGVYFQILDDYVNLQSDRYMKNKSFCEDLTEGKFSFPIIHAIHANPHDHRILNILKQRTGDYDIKKHAVDYMRTLGTFDYTVRVVDKLFRQVLNEIDKLGGNPELVKILHYLHELSGVKEKKATTSAKVNSDEAASSSSS